MKKNGLYIKWGLTAFLTVCAILLVYDTFFSTGALIVFLRKLLRILAPVLYGFFIAYLLTPVVNFFERGLLKPMAERFRKPGEMRSGPCRAISLFLTFCVVFIVFYLLLSILLPELYKSILQLVNNAENYYNTVYHWVNDLLDKNPDVEAWVTSQLDISYQNLLTWLTNKAIPQAQQLLTAAAGGVMNLLTFVKNLVVGLIVSIYLLATKENCAASCRRLLYSAINEQRAHWTLRGISKMDAIFSGFVRGKLLDSLIIGVLCFISCSLLKLPYTPLVSVIVGVTNVIPFFGPFLGAIPSAFLILLVSPKQCLIFIILVLVLQQLDGNVIGPKILGGSTGLSSFWVIVAILVGGGLFGLPGMFFGVPIFACFYTAINFFSDRKLRDRGLPTGVRAYTAGDPRQGPPEPPKEDSGGRSS